MDIQIIRQRIFVIRQQQVMLDYHLAELYGVETRILKQAVRRNINRFPADFMFELEREEFQNLTSQFVMSSYGGTRHLPFAFTEQGVAMLSSVLNSPQAVAVNIEIMRTFVSLRRINIEYEWINHRLDELEKQYDAKFDDIFMALEQLLMKPKERNPIGFKKID
jgi:ORF6N domain